jgi:shikimate dehydrogenase
VTVDLDRHLATPIEALATSRARFAGIIGDRPSQYAKSPSLWNPTFEALGVDAVYVPFDVDGPNLPPLVEALRRCERLLGFNVTVPYKVTILPLLDQVETNARRIGAINTVVRTGEGRLVGYNTDGQGAIDSLLRTTPGQAAPFLGSLAGLRAVLLGAGGSARAVAFFLAEALGPRGRLAIGNRAQDRADELASKVAEAYGNCASVSESELDGALAEADLVVNATTKGQAGLRALAGGRTTCLEPYSALAPADPPELERDQFGTPQEFYRRWFPLARRDIQNNAEISSERLAGLAPAAALFDLIYAPLETVFLRQGRLSGHPTLNGKGMNIWQAVNACCDKVMKDRVPGEPGALRQRVFEVMASVW